MSRQSIENRNPQLCRRFVEMAKIIFSRHPEIEHRWSLDADKDHCILEIVGVGAPGYDICIEVHPDKITVSAEGFHNHYLVNDPHEDYLQEFFGRIRDMLSPAMRIREQLANGSPYRWHLENQTHGQWRTESTCGLLFWNWFGCRSERCHFFGILSDDNCCYRAAIEWRNAWIFAASGCDDKRVDSFCPLPD